MHERTEQKIMDTAITKEMYKEMGIDEKVLFFRTGNRGESERAI
jgi:hypothetical protein